MAAVLNRVSFAVRKCSLNHLKLNSLSRLSCLKRSFSVSFIQFGPRKFSEKHEWIAVDGNVGTVGISSYAQDALGEVVYVQLPEVGSTLAKDDECGVLESVKAVNEVFSPASGKVIEVNEELSEKPSYVNESCYDKGWICKLELSNPKELDELMNEEAYETFLKTVH